MLQDFFTDPIGFILEYFGLIQPYLFLAAQLVVLFIVYIFVTRGLSRRFKKMGVSREASTGVLLIIRLLFFIVSLLAIVSSFDPAFTTLLSVSTVFGTTLGLAISRTASGIVSGLYILIARPFRVGDYVRIGDDEGIVTDITLSYTKIRKPDETRLRIPNNKVLESDIVNFRVELKDVIKDVAQERLGTKEIEQRSALTKALMSLRGLTHVEIAYRYTFDLSINYSFDHKSSRENFEKVCDDWADIFVTRPEYQVWDTMNNAITYRFEVLVSDPYDLLEHISNFMDDLLIMYR